MNFLKNNPEINKISAKELMDEGLIPYTIHDSIIIEKKYQNRALEIVENVFKQYFNILPQFKIEDL